MILFPLAAALLAASPAPSSEDALWSLVFDLEVAERQEAAKAALSRGGSAAATVLLRAGRTAGTRTALVRMRDGRAVRLLEDALLESPKLLTTSAAARSCLACGATTRGLILFESEERYTSFYRPTGEAAAGAGWDARR